MVALRALPLTVTDFPPPETVKLVTLLELSLQCTVHVPLAVHDADTPVGVAGGGGGGGGWLEVDELGVCVTVTGAVVAQVLPDLGDVAPAKPTAWT